MINFIRLFVPGLIVLCAFLKTDAYAANAGSGSKAKAYSPKHSKSAQKKAHVAKHRATSHRAKGKMDRNKIKSLLKQAFEGAAQAALARDGYDLTRAFNRVDKKEGSTTEKPAVSPTVSGRSQGVTRYRMKGSLYVRTNPYLRYKGQRRI